MINYIYQERIDIPAELLSDNIEILQTDGQAGRKKDRMKDRKKTMKERQNERQKERQ